MGGIALTLSCLFWHYCLRPALLRFNINTKNKLNHDRSRSKTPSLFWKKNYLMQNSCRHFPKPEIYFREWVLFYMMLLLIGINGDEFLSGRIVSAKINSHYFWTLTLWIILDMTIIAILFFIRRFSLISFLIKWKELFNFTFIGMLIICFTMSLGILTMLFLCTISFLHK